MFLNFFWYLRRKTKYYFLIKKIVSILESISLQNNLLGCFKSSKDFTEILDENWVSSNKKTALSCFIYCENKGYAVSGFNFFDDCICGRFSKK